MSNGFTITRDAQRCIGCNECFIVCPQSGTDKPHSVLILAPEKGKPPEIDCIANCIQCLTCWDFCRSRAITFENYHQVRRLTENALINAKVAKII
jgi:formate hydrogenlyase subunit 6/NADH:ubiquinone oxidoreductase subunit I